MRRALLCVSGMITAGLTSGASAAEVKPGGALDVSISGFARFLVSYGDLDKKPNLFTSDAQRRGASSFDFLNDTEVHILVRGMHDATGLEYGATVELEADTNRVDNADETWLYVRGGFGELRLGDTDSAANNMKIGAYTVAVGSGGIDGSIVEVPQLVIVDYSIRGSQNNQRIETLNNTKIVYYSPVIAGLQLGVSYTPDVGQVSVTENGQSLDVGQNGDLLNRSEADENTVSDEVTVGLAYTGLLGPVGLRASVVGALAAHDAVDTNSVYTGAAFDIGDFSFAGGAGLRRRSNRYSSADVTSVLSNRTLERQQFNIGAAYQFDPFAFSINYGKAWESIGSDTNDKGRFSDLVFGVEVGLFPGLVLSTEAAYFSAKRTGGDAEDDARRDNDGWVGITRLALAF